MSKRLAILIVSLAALAASSHAAGQACPSGFTQVLWPASSPVWDLCFVRPAVTDSRAIDGEGITLVNVKYKGVLILSRLSIPILNVKYDSGCGPCYRDWFYQERAFECAPTVAPGQCSGAATPATTVCQHPGFDAGTFSGVSVEDRGTHLKLMSQSEAGWYRYIPVYEFWPNGTIQARLDATSVSDSCVQYTHNHHAYWRMDIDLGGSAGDFVDDLTAPVGSRRITTERNFLDTSGQRRRWLVGSSGTAYNVEVIRNPGDQGAGDPPLVAGDVPVADGWVLSYVSNEVSDQFVTSGCAAGLNSFVNNENVDGTDVVLWVRGGGYHVGELGQTTPDSCHMFGPTIRVREAALSASNFHTLTPCRVLDTRNPPGPLGGPALAANSERTFTLPTQCGIPVNARAVAANLTVTEPNNFGYLQIAPLGGPIPLSSVINFAPGQTRANNATLSLGEGGGVVVRSFLGTGSVHFLLDVTGYYD